MSLISPTQALAANNRRPAEVVAATLPNNHAAIDAYSNTRNASASPFSTLPGGSSSVQPSIANESSFGAAGRVDDFGAIKPTVSSTSNTINNATAAPSLSAQPTSTPASSVSPGRRPNSGGGGNRFTITNAQPLEIPQENVSRQRSAQTAGPGANSAQKSYPTAEQEKKLYEQAIAKVAKVQVRGLLCPDQNKIKSNELIKLVSSRMLSCARHPLHHNRSLDRQLYPREPRQLQNHKIIGYQPTMRSDSTNKRKRQPKEPNWARRRRS